MQTNQRHTHAYTTLGIIDQATTYPQCIPYSIDKRDWKRVHICTINTSTPCWNRNELIDHAHFISASIAHVKLGLWQQAYLNAS